MFPAKHIRTIREIASERIKPVIEKNIFYPQFRFGNQHFTIDQVHRITEKSLEEDQVCTAMFLFIP